MGILQELSTYTQINTRCIHTHRRCVVFVLTRSLSKHLLLLIDKNKQTFNRRT